jgi:hypothetical protein
LEVLGSGEQAKNNAEARDGARHGRLALVSRAPYTKTPTEGKETRVKRLRRSGASEGRGREKRRKKKRKKEKLSLKIDSETS